jgi:hypothetical protein
VDQADEDGSYGGKLWQADCNVCSRKTGHRTETCVSHLDESMKVA